MFLQGVAGCEQLIGLWIPGRSCCLRRTVPEPTCQQGLEQLVMMSWHADGLMVGVLLDTLPVHRSQTQWGTYGPAGLRLYQGTTFI